jgi:citrate lyase beta subunit
MAACARKSDLIILPKLESAGEVLIYEKLISQIKARPSLRVIIESSRGILNADTIVSGGPSMTCLTSSAADLSAELGSQTSWEAMYAHPAAIITACGLKGETPVDSPYINIRD